MKREAILTIPCKQNKCILYPICISKFEIECDFLSSYYGKMSNETYDSEDEKAWNEIEKILPKLQEIHGPIVNGKHLQYRAYTIYKYPDPGIYTPGESS